MNYVKRSKKINNKKFTLGLKQVKHKSETKIKKAIFFVVTQQKVTKTKMNIYPILFLLKLYPWMKFLSKVILLLFTFPAVN